MTVPNDFAKLLPGYDFLQGLMKNASAGLPNMSQWIAPTLDPEEIAKRIADLRTVQFWLEQNAKLIGTTIQALEVQKMTLSTLRTMNVPLPDLGEALKLKTPEPAPAPPVAAAPAAPAAATAAPAAPAIGAIDPMQWWGALTKQFGDIASAAMQDVRGAAMPAVGAEGAELPEPEPRRAPRARPAAKTARSASRSAAPAAKKRAAPRKRAA